MPDNENFNFLAAIEKWWGAIGTQLRSERSDMLRTLHRDGTDKNNRDLQTFKDYVHSHTDSWESAAQVAVSKAEESIRLTHALRGEFREVSDAMKERMFSIEAQAGGILDRENDRIIRGDRVLADSEKACGDAKGHCDTANKAYRRIVNVGSILLLLFALGLLVEHFWPRISSPAVSMADIQKAIRENNIELLKALRK